MLTTSLVSCSSNESTVESDSEAFTQTRIQGTVIEQTSAMPIRDAIVTTDPATEVVLTDIDGRYVITDGFNGSGSFRVFAEHFAYENQQATTTVTDNRTSTVDFVLQSNAIGLQANTSQIIFPPDQSRETFRLTSNIQNTGYFILASDPWISVSPQTGVISNRETAVIEIEIDRSQISEDSIVNSEIVINSDNGTRELVISLQIRNSDTTPEVGTRQLDCRRPDVFRVGYDIPGASLVQFLDSLHLPRDIGLRSVQIINPVFVDSFVVEELGTVTIDHVNGDTLDTTLVLFELGPDERAVEFIRAVGTSPFDSRASISFALLPGIYCYILAPTNGNFSVPENILLDFGFIPPQ